MATTTPTPLHESTATTEAPGPRKMRGRFATRRGVFTWAAVLAALTAAIARAVVTLTGGDDAGPLTGAHTGFIEHGSIRSIEGSVEDSVAGGPVAPWCPCGVHRAWQHPLDRGLGRGQRRPRPPSYALKTRGRSCAAMARYFGSRRNPRPLANFCNRISDSGH
jgi:hypothetical protein